MDSRTRIVRNAIRAKRAVFEGLESRLLYAASPVGAAPAIGNFSPSNTIIVADTQAPPTFTLSGPASVNEGATYTLGLAASDPGQTISSWQVDWGDGNTQTLTGNPSAATHVYALGPNSYTVSATATDGIGTYSAANTLSISVAHVPPNLLIAGIDTASEQSPYTLDLLGTDPGHTISGWSINWGDGNIQTVVGNPTSEKHTYALGPNSYTISATATDDVSTYVAANIIAVSVAHVPPILSISGAASVHAQLPYTLSLSATDPGHTILSWQINWGDGNSQTVTGNTSSVTHVFLTGSQIDNISAAATDDVGTCSSCNSIPLSVIPNGWVDSANMNEIAGWAVDPNNPSASINIEIDIAGGPTQTVSANQSRPDLQAIFGSTNHGFVYSTPVLSVGSHTASIYAVESDDTKVLVATETLVSQNSLFDEHYYLTEYPAVAAAVANGQFASGYDHYLQYGQYEGYSPSPYWDENWYLQENPDVAAAVKTGSISSGFMHFYLYGQYENRGGLLFFNTSYYLANNPDVAAAVTAGTLSSAFEHFVLFGQYEGRSPMLYFSSTVYDANNQDILPYVTGAPFSSDFEHFIEYGQYEGRIASTFYCEQTYLADNPDVAAAVASGQYPDGFIQWLEWGQFEGRTAV